MKRLMLVLAACAGLALAAGTAWADPPNWPGGHQKASVQLARYGHHGHHGDWDRGHHDAWRYRGGAYYYPRPYVPYRSYYPVYPYPVYPYGASGITIYGPRLGVSIGF